MDFPGKNPGVGCHFLLQGIFLTQGSNPGLPHCRLKEDASIKVSIKGPTFPQDTSAALSLPGPNPPRREMTSIRACSPKAYCCNTALPGNEGGHYFTITEIHEFAVNLESAEAAGPWFSIMTTHESYLGNFLKSRYPGYTQRQ